MVQHQLEYGQTNATDFSTVTKSENSVRTDARTQNVQMALLGAGLVEEEWTIIWSGAKPWEQLIKWMHESEEEAWSLQLFITKFRKINEANSKQDADAVAPVNSIPDTSNDKTQTKPALVTSAPVRPKNGE